MKGYQRVAHPQHTAGSLADVPREDQPNVRKMHGERPEGSSYCIQGRKSYQITSDPALVTCKGCRKLMGLEEKA